MVSPMAYYGYDVLRPARRRPPVRGMDALDRLIEAAHARGIKLDDGPGAQPHQLGASAGSGRAGRRPGATIKRTKKAAFYDNWLIRIPNTFNGRRADDHDDLPAAREGAALDGYDPDQRGVPQLLRDRPVRRQRIGQVLVPAAFETTTSGGPITQAADHGGYHVYTSGKVADPDKWYVGITGTNDAGRVHQSLTSANGRPIETRAGRATRRG